MVSLSSSLASIWEWGTIRGGTPALLLGDRYLTFFHSSKKRCRLDTPVYFMDALIFSAKPRREAFNRLKMFYVNYNVNWSTKTALALELVAIFCKIWKIMKLVRCEWKVENSSLKLVSDLATQANLRDSFELISLEHEGLPSSTRHMYGEYGNTHSNNFPENLYPITAAQKMDHDFIAVFTQDDMESAIPTNSHQQHFSVVDAAESTTKQQWLHVHIFGSHKYGLVELGLYRLGRYACPICYAVHIFYDVTVQFRCRDKKSYSKVVVEGCSWIACVSNIVHRSLSIPSHLPSSVGPMSPQVEVLAICIRLIRSYCSLTGHTESPTSSSRGGNLAQSRVLYLGVDVPRSQ
eukprot:gene13017-27468_t